MIDCDRMTHNFGQCDNINLLSYYAMVVNAISPICVCIVLDCRQSTYICVITSDL